MKNLPTFFIAIFISSCQWKKLQTNYDPLDNQYFTEFMPCKAGQF